MSGWDGVGFGDFTCQEFVELVTEYLEGRLDTVARGRFEAHIADCPGCADYLEQIQDTRRALGHVTLAPLSPSARDQLLIAFRSWRSERGADD